MSMHTPAHKSTEHPAAQVPVPERFRDPTLGPLVAREVHKDACVALDGTPCIVFASLLAECPNMHGGPSCHPHRRPNGKSIIWIRDPAYAK